MVGIVLLGFLVLVALVGVLLISVVFTRNAVDAQLSGAFYGLVLVCALLAAGLLYLLLRLPRTLRSAQSDLEATQRVTRTPATASPSAPAPSIEYGRESRDVEVLEGIGSVFSRRLARQGIETLDDLRAASVEQVATAAHVQASVAQVWKTMAELLRIPEVDAQAAELLVRCDIQTIDELAQSSPVSLLKEARIVNGAGRNRIYPHEIEPEVVDRWINAAKAHVVPVGSVSRKRGARGTSTV